MTEPPQAALHVTDAPEVTAPDGSLVRVLMRTGRGSMARFSLPPGAVSHAVCHRSVEELWYVIAGTGRMWQRRDGQESMIDLVPGLSLAIATGTDFQFRALSGESLQAIGVTMPPWPGADEAQPVTGPWTPTE